MLGPRPFLAPPRLLAEAMLGAASRSTGDAVSYTDGAGVCSPVMSSVKRDCLRGSCGLCICDRKGELANDAEGEGVDGTAAASGMLRGVVGGPKSAMVPVLGERERCCGWQVSSVSTLGPGGVALGAAHLRVLVQQPVAAKPSSPSIRYPLFSVW